MAIEARAGAMPLWIIVSLAGQLAGGAKMYTRRSLNKTEMKPVYQDAAMTIEYTNPIQFGLNGTTGTPFYFEYDPDHPEETYYLEVRDADNNLLWSLDGYTPGEGGGSSGSTYLPFRNLISNSTMLHHIDNLSNPLLDKDIFIAPSNHHGFTPNQLNPVITADHGVVGPDIWFTKNNLNALDQISFGIFNAGDDPLTGDVTPLDYVRYQCGNNPTGETYKHFQFPIMHKVNNLDNQILTATVWARTGGGAPGLNFYLRQYFGSEGGETEVFQLVGNRTLTGTWTRYVINMTVPNTSGKTLGACGDDALYFCIEMPLGQICDIQFCKPALYLGSVAPAEEFETYDQIDAIIETPRTGQVKHMMANYTPSGWLRMNGTTIGSPSSTATRSKLDTFSLYKTLWDSVPDLYAPVIGGRGGSAAADYAANKPLTLTSALGRVLMGMAPLEAQSIAFTSTAANGQLAVADASIFYRAQPIRVNDTNTAGITPHVYYVIPVDATHIKLAETVEGAIGGTSITVIDGGGDLLNALGTAAGESKHTLTVQEMPSHRHYLSQFGVNLAGGGEAVSAWMPDKPPFNKYTEFEGGGLSHNNLPPYLISNIFIKL